MAEVEYNYAEDLAIDLHKLEEEWQKQPQLCVKYSNTLADAIKAKDKIWERLKVRRSELIKWASANPGELEGGKATGPVVEAYYRTHQDHRDLKDDLVEAEYQVNILQGIANSFDYQRKAAIEGEVALWIGQYFIGPKEPRTAESGKRMIDMKIASIANTSADIRKSLNEGADRKPRPTRQRKRG